MEEAPAPGKGTAVEQPLVASKSDGPGRLSAVHLALLVSMAHGLTDGYAAFLPPLLPRLMDRLGLSVALAAALATILNLAVSLLQPLFGYLGDRFGRRPFVIAGPLFTGAFLSLIGVTPSFATLVLLLVLGGLGSAAFHPPGAALAARVEEGGGSGLRYSFFSFGGTVGFALGPLAAVGIVSGVGLDGLWLAMIPCLLWALVLYRTLPGGSGDRPTHRPPSPLALLRRLRGPLGLIFGVSAAAAFVQRVFLTMMPIAAAEAGRSEAVGALMLSTYLAAQAVGTVAGGWLADRMDRRLLLVLLTLFGLPAHVAAFWLPAGSAGALEMAAAAGFLNMATLPPIVVGAQELVPRGAAAISGIVMGLAWAAGSLGVLGTGILGDHVGARSASLLSMPLLLVGTLLALHPSLSAGHGGSEDDSVGADPRGSV